MEMVMELAVSKRSSQSRKHASRGWLVLVMIGMLCFDSRSYAKDAPANRREISAVIKPGRIS